MTLTLHNPISQAHIEDLKDRPSAQLTQAPSDPYGRTWMQAVMGTLVEAVQAMDRGAASETDTREIFQSFPVPGFRFGTWLAEMVEEGVYLERTALQAA